MPDEMTRERVVAGTGIGGTMIHDAAAAGITIPRSFAGPIERSVGIENQAGVHPWVPEPQMREYSTWQLQQLRRVMRCLRAMAWERDLSMMADEVDEITSDELWRRGAWTCRWAHDVCPCGRGLRRAHYECRLCEREAADAR